MRSRNQLRRERNDLVCVALVILLMITGLVCGLVAQIVVNTGAAMGYGMIAVIAFVAALAIILERTAP